MLSRVIASLAAGVFLASVPPAVAQDLFPDGPGKDILATKCRNCHMPDRVTKVAGRPAASWQTLVNTMINRGAPVTEDELPILVEYLAKNWSVDKATPPLMTFVPVAPMASHVGAEFTEWEIPAPASGVTAALAVSDGSIWYTSAEGNVLGRLDPKTGDVKEHRLKTPQSGPRGLVEDRNGNIWYAASLTGQLGKLDPKTGNVTEYPVAGHGRVRSPRTRLGSKGKPLVHAPGREHGWALHSEHGDVCSAQFPDAEIASVGPRREPQGHPVLR
jgi:virginiamycin B lyase